MVAKQTEPSERRSKRLETCYDLIFYKPKCKHSALVLMRLNLCSYCQAVLITPEHCRWCLKLRVFSVASANPRRLCVATAFLTQSAQSIRRGSQRHFKFRHYYTVPRMTSDKD